MQSEAPSNQHVLMLAYHWTLYLIVPLQSATSYWPAPNPDWSVIYRWTHAFIYSSIYSSVHLFIHCETYSYALHPDFLLWIFSSCVCLVEYLLVLLVVVNFLIVDCLFNVTQWIDVVFTSRNKCYFHQINLSGSVLLSVCWLNYSKKGMSGLRWNLVTGLDIRFWCWSRFFCGFFTLRR